MARIEIPELIGNMHITQSEKQVRNRSNYIDKNDILIVEVTSDVNEDFVSEVCENKSEETNVAIIGIENNNENALYHATVLIEILKSKSMCIIAICKDENEVDENGYSIQYPIEVQMKTLKSTTDLLIITQSKHDYRDVIDLLLVCDQTYLGTKKCTTSEFLYSRFKNSGFAYYNCIYAEKEWNPRTLIHLAMFDSMFVCPIYKAKEVFLQIEAGEEFQLSEGNELKDEGIILGELEDHLQENCSLNSWWDIYEMIPPFAIKLEFLFWNFDENIFVFDEKHTWKYPKAENRRLEKRIDRLMQTPFYTRQKRKKYRQYKRELRNNSQ